MSDRPLLPAPEGYQRTPLPPAKNRHITSACHNCRVSKVKCDGRTPTCTACAKRSIICQRIPTEKRQVRQKYTELQQRESSYADLIEMLKTMSDRDAVEVVHRLKAGMDVTSILSQVRDGNLLMQLSLTPETTRRFEFPLVAEMPSHLRIADNPYLNSLLYQHTFAPPVSRRWPDSDDAAQAASENVLTYQGLHDQNTNRESTEHTTGRSVYELPYHTARVVEPLLESITAAPWTSVISDDRLLRQLIGSYFKYPHPCGPFVPKDLFLQDMAVYRTSFCSPLLVNAILTNASQSCLDIHDRSKMWVPFSLTYQLMAEARRLWEVESLPGKSKITTIQAALVLSYFTTNNGLDEVGSMYSKRACEMSEDLGLFTSKYYEGEIKKARVFTAWALFSWQSTFDFAFYRQPYFSQPPSDPALESSWYDEVLLQFPRDQGMFPLHLGFCFHSDATLHGIVNEAGLRLFGKPSLPQISSDEVAALIRRLDLWLKTLPEPLRPENVVFPVHLMLHVQYWQLMTNIVRLLSNDDFLDESRTFSLRVGRTPQSCLHEANIMTQTVTCLYYARHSFQFYDPWIAFALTIVGNAAISELKAGNFDSVTLTNHRAILILSAQGLASQGLNFHNGKLLAVQLQGAMSPEDLQLVCKHATAASISESDRKMIAENPHSHWPVPGMVAVNEDPEKARLKGLVEAFVATQI